MKLSVIILNHNQTETTLRCLESLRRIVESLDWTEQDIEIILIDNGSRNVIPNNVLCRYSSLRYYPLPENIGVSRGRNYGLEMATGDYIMILDNDTIVNKNAVLRLIDHLSQSASTGIVAPALKNMDGTLQYSFRKYPGLIEKFTNLTGHNKGRHSMDNKEVINPCYVIGACQMFRRNILDEIGKLDEKIFYGPEDADFCIRISKAGYTVDYLTGVSIYHDHRRITRRNPFTRLAFRHLKGLIYLYRKHNRWLY